MTRCVMRNLCRDLVVLLDDGSAGQGVRDAAAAGVRDSASALFLAGKAFAQYRSRGGARQQVLPDFLIGAHAAVEGWPLLTRDATRFRTYYPGLEVLAP